MYKEHCNCEDNDEYFTIDLLKNVNITSSIIQAEESKEIGKQLISNSTILTTKVTVKPLNVTLICNLNQ